MKRSELIFTFLLVPLDLIMIAAAFLAAYYVRFKTSFFPVINIFPLTKYIEFFFCLLPFWIIIFALSGLYSLRVTRRGIKELKSILVACSTGVMLIILIIIFLQKYEYFFSRLTLIYLWLFSIVFVTIGRTIIHQIQKFLFKRNIGIYRILVFGPLEPLKQAIEKSPHLGYKIVAQTDKLLGLEKTLKEKNIDLVILTNSCLAQEEVANLIEICEKNFVDFKFLPNLYELVPSNINILNLNGLPILELIRTPLDGWGRIVKRLMDILCSLIGLIVLSPFLLLVAILVKITSPGPIFYSHERVGRDGKKFRLYKFRSMYQNAEYKVGHFWSVKDESKDPRITPFGRILRRTAIDELPQLFNVLKGDMSLVGPRPEQPRFVEEFQKNIPEYFRRHKVKSGITGWAQVNGLRGDTSISERVKYDLYYIENWSLWFDIKIILKTFLMILKTGQGNQN